MWNFTTGQLICWTLGWLCLGAAVGTIILARLVNRHLKEMYDALQRELDAL